MSAGLHPEVLTVNTPCAPHLVEKQDGAKRVQPCTAAQLAAEASVSRRMIFLALKVKQAGCPELHESIRNGRVSMSLAASLVDLFPSHEDQRTVLAEFATLPARQWLGFARRVHSLMKVGGKSC